MGRSPLPWVMVCLLLLVTCGVAPAGVITKPPDIGTYWHPLSANGGTYVYADSFVAPDSGMVSVLGMWLADGPGGAGPISDLRLDIYDSIGGNPANGPDTTIVLATTGVLPAANFSGPLAYYEFPVLPGGAALVTGQTYWFAGNVVGLTPAGDFWIGGHTQNSVYSDNGTFWWSNDPSGIAFDGRNQTPEMAFSVTTGVIPEPATLSLLGLGLLAIARRRRRR